MLWYVYLMSAALFQQSIPFPFFIASYRKLEHVGLEILTYQENDWEANDCGKFNKYANVPRNKIKLKYEFSCTPDADKALCYAKIISVNSK